MSTTSPEVRAQILSAVKDDGVTVPEAAKAHHVSEDAVYKWLKVKADNEEMEPPNSCETIEKFIETIHHLIYSYNTKRIHTALKMPPRKFYEELMKRWNALQKSLSPSVY